MDLTDTISAHVRALPTQLQQEALDFIGYLTQRYSIAPASTGNLSTEAFIKQFAGCVGADFPDDIKLTDLAEDCKRDQFECFGIQPRTWITC
jgi:hypothetical protein